MSPVLDDLVAQVRNAAGNEDRSARLRAILKDNLSDRDKIADAIAATEDDEVLLFEDETCSI